MNAQLMTRTLAALALAGAILGIAWAQDKPPAVPGQPPAKQEAKEEDEEQVIKPTDAPQAVQAAINKLTSGKNIKNVSRETDEGARRRDREEMGSDLPRLDRC